MPHVYANIIQVFITYCSKVKVWLFDANKDVPNYYLYSRRFADKDALWTDIKHFL